MLVLFAIFILSEPLANSGAVVADAEVVDDEAKGDFKRGVVEIAGGGRFVIVSGEEVGG